MDEKERQIDRRLSGLLFHRLCECVSVWVCVFLCMLALANASASHHYDCFSWMLSLRLKGERKTGQERKRDKEWREHRITAGKPSSRRTITVTHAHRQGLQPACAIIKHLFFPSFTAAVSQQQLSLRSLFLAKEGE